CGEQTWRFANGSGSSHIACWADPMRSFPHHRTRALLRLDQHRRLRRRLWLQLLDEIEGLAALLGETLIVSLHDCAIAPVVGVGIGAALRSTHDRGDDLLNLLRCDGAALRQFVI